MKTKGQNSSRLKRIYGTAFIFYFLIAFEFFYMATPFAMYFYSVYKPGLDFISGSPLLAWMGSFFLPHLAVDTSSVLLNIRVEAGIALAALGFIGFCAGAFQVYYYKLAKKGAVTGGIYKIIRHPQYASLILCSFGLLILWPRYLALFSFVLMLFVYYSLAWIEERECEVKFGPSYLEYKRRTGMFLPFNLLYGRKHFILPQSGLKRFAATLLLFIAVSIITAIGAHFIKQWSAGKIFVLYKDNSAYISVTRIENSSLKNTVHAVLANNEVQALLKQSKSGEKFLNYVLPAEYYALEIPMLSENSGEGYHFIKRQFSGSIYKIIFTRAEGAGIDAQGKDILLQTIRKKPLFEVWLDAKQNKLIRLVTLSDKHVDSGIIGPVF